MNQTEYRAAREQLSYSVGEWCEVLAISPSSHRKYVSGERDIPPRVTRMIALLMENFDLKRENFYLKHRK